MEEFKIRHLVNEIAKDILEIDDVLKTLNISREEYIKLSETRSFKEILGVAQIEWQGATNTPRRARLKAAAMTEELMLNLFYVARDSQESLSAKIKALETFSRIAGLSTPDPVQQGATGNSFNLQINFSSGKNINVDIGGGGERSDEEEGDIIEGDYSQSEGGGVVVRKEVSTIFAGDTLEEL